MKWLKFLLVIPVFLLNGLALMLLWGWFITTTFALPAISFVQAVGISVIFDLLTRQYIHRKDKGEMISANAYAFYTPVLCIIIGWVFRFFV